MTKRYGIVSDLHLDFYNDMEMFAIVHKIANADCDMMIFAGDIFESEENRNRFYDYCNVLRFSVMGNHDFYGSNIYDDYHVEENIHGGCLWTDLNNDPVLELKAKGALNDFHHIKNEKGTNFVTPFDMRNIFEYQAHRIFNTPKEIVVTHFAPCHLSIHKRYRGDYYNPYFVNNLHRHMEKMETTKLWVHGHVHNAHDYTLDNGMRVVCNPLGYPNENYRNVEDYQVKIVEI